MKFKFLLNGALWLGLILSSVTVNAATYYVDTAAPDNNGNGSQSAPKKYISSGVQLMSPAGGDTLIILPGIYNNALDRISDGSQGGPSTGGVVNGQAGAYNTIKASQDGAVIIQQPIQVSRSSRYVRLEGLRWENREGSTVSGSYMKILRCSFQGAPDRGNVMTLAVGGSFNLLEDVWVYGKGGRYNIIVYDSENVILRRVVVRHDAGWSDIEKANEPQAGISIYNSSNVLVQNSIGLDNTLDYRNVGSNNTWYGPFFVVQNPYSAPHPTDNVHIIGSFAVNSVGSGVYFSGGPISNSSFTDSVIWAMENGIVSNGQLGRIQAQINSSLIGRTDEWGVAQYGVGSYGNQITVNNSIIFDNASGDLLASVGSIVESNNLCYGNGRDYCAASARRYDPLTNGLIYLPRIESGSRLATDGVGHMAINRLGVSGTLWGETGYDQVTSQALWPWPNEDRIKNEMCDEANSGVADRGLCLSGQSLTDYIWGMVGNGTPPNTGPVPVPANVRIRKM